MYSRLGIIPDLHFITINGYQSDYNPGSGYYSGFEKVYLRAVSTCILNYLFTNACMAWYKQLYQPLSNKRHDK